MKSTDDPISFDSETSADNLLGRGQNQRSSELQAGARAQLIPSPVTLALSSTAGRTISRIFMALQENSLTSYVILRPHAQLHLIRKAVAEHQEPVVLDPICGYSPVGIWTAEAMPHARIIEMDAPRIVTDKHTRLQQASHVQVPPNIQWLPADLRRMGLRDVLGGQMMDLIIAQGAYLHRADFVRLLRSLRQNLKPDGFILGHLPWGPGIEKLKEASRLFRMQVGELPGMVKSEDEIHDIFQTAGFSKISIFTLAQLAQELHFGTPADVENFILAQ